MIRTARLLFVIALLSGSALWTSPAAAIGDVSNPFAEPELGLSHSMAMYIQRLVREKQYDAALKELDGLERQRPADYALASAKGAVYFAKNDYVNARKSYERAVTLNPKSGLAQFQLAQLDIVTGNAEAARKRLTALLEAEPRNARAMAGMAGVAAATGQDAEFVAWLQKAIAADPGDERPYVLLVNYYLRKGDPQQAITRARELLTREPDNRTGLDLMGAAQLAAGDAANAVRTFSRLVLLAPGDPQSRYKLATAMLVTRDYDGARRELRTALSANPDFLEAKALLATVEIQGGRPEDGLRLAREIQAKRPRLEVGWQLEGDALMAQKGYASAEQAYQKAYAMRKTAALAMKLHAAMSAGGKPADGEAVLVAFLREQPRNAAARHYLAASYLKDGRNKDAIEQYTALVQVEPDNPAALNELAWAYQQEKDPRALATAEQALKLRPNNADILDTTGWILVEQGNTTRGLELLRRAVELAPQVPVMRYHLAVGLARTGETERARRELEAMLDRNPQFPERAQAEQLLSQLRR